MLSKFQTSTLGIEWYLSRIKVGKIDLNPPYQRDIVWSVSKQQFLIDSALRDFPIPAIFLKKNGKEKYECVDGKQRLTSFYKFMIEQSLKIENKDDENFSESKEEFLKFDDLNENVQELLKQTQITCYTLSEDWKDIEIFDLFKRVQNGSPLTTGEFINAYNSEDVQKAKRYVKDRAESYLKNLKLRFDRYGELVLVFVFVILSDAERNDFKAMTSDSIKKYVQTFRFTIDHEWIMNDFFQKVIKIKHEICSKKEKKKKFLNRWELILVFKYFIDTGRSKSKVKDVILFLKNDEKPVGWKSSNNYSTICFKRRYKIIGKKCNDESNDACKKHRARLIMVSKYH